MRVVLDTNIFVSMLLGGRLGTLNDDWKAEKFVLVVSDAIVSEYADVLLRPKLRLAADTVAAILDRVQRKAVFVTPDGELSVIADDPTDNKFLDAALAANADYVVSGDAHILNLESFRSIPILTARRFLELLSA